MFSNSTYQNLDFKYKDQPKKVLALISGRKSGKSFLAQVITEVDSRFAVRSFADPLKEMYAETTGTSLSDLYHQKNKEKYRQGLIDLSWQMKHDKGMFVWAESYFNSYFNSELVVCDDMRLLEELQLLCMFGGAAYRVWAEPHQRRAWGWDYDPAIDEEISETDLTRLSAHTLLVCTGGGFIYNTSSGKDHLYPQITQILGKHFPEQVASLASTEELKKLVKLEL